MASVYMDGPNPPGGWNGNNPKHRAVAEREARPTGKQIRAWLARIAPGVRLTCLANTYNSSAPGSSGKVMRVGKSFVVLKRDDGQKFWLYPPVKVGRWVSIEGEAATYYIDPLRGDHTATWRIDTVSA